MYIFTSLYKNAVRGGFLRCFWGRFVFCGGRKVYPLPRLPFFVRYAAFSVIFFFFILHSCYLYPICYVVLHCLYCWYCLLRIYVCSYSTILVSWYCDIVLLLLCCFVIFFLCVFLFFLCYNLIFIFILDKINIIIRVIIYTMHDKYYIYYYDKNLC